MRPFRTACSLSDSFRLWRDRKAGGSGSLIYGRFHICFIRAKQLKGLPSILFKKIKKKLYFTEDLSLSKSFCEICQTLCSRRMTVLFFLSVLLSPLLKPYQRWFSSCSCVTSITCHSLMGLGVLWKHFFSSACNLGGTNLNPLFFVFFLYIRFFLLFWRINFPLATYHSFVIIVFITMIFTFE